jgi:hypothetical protein
MATHPADAFPGGLPAERAELARCAASPAHFLDAHAIIDDAHGADPAAGTMPFKLWDAQRGLLADLQSNRLIIILKARQLGISWLCCGYALWLCLFHTGRVVLIFSKGEKEAREMVRRARLLYQRLPAWLRTALPPLVRTNLGAIEWANDSRIESFPATQTAGSGYTASLVIMDEAAKMEYAGQLYGSVKPTIDGEGDAGQRGQLIVLSTAFGVGNLFHDLWTKAVEGVNGFKAIFLPWWARPGRDRAWHDRVAVESTDPESFKQDYPGCPTDAFTASGRPRFPAAWVEAQAPYVHPGLPPDRWPEPLRGLPGFTLYRPPTPGRRTVVAADVGEGKPHSNFSTAVVLDAATREELACLHGRWEMDVFAGYLYIISRTYAAEVVVERNNHGHAVLLALRYRGLTPAMGLDGEPGWVTSPAVKPLMVDVLAESLRDGRLAVHSLATLHEMQIYQVTEKGGTEAPTGKTDDRVMSWAIGLGYLTLRPEVMPPMLAGERSVGHVGGALPGMGYAPVGYPGGGHPAGAMAGHVSAVGAMAPMPGNGRRP